MRKSIKIILTLTLILTLSTSLTASSLIRDITGKENKGITVKYNNQVQNLKDGNGSPVYPVIINGSTYLPVRAIGNMLDAGITWEGNTKTIYITEKGTNKDVDTAVPTDLPSANSSSNSTMTKPSKPKHQASNLGTLENPIDIGTEYSFNFINEYSNNKMSADYTVAITDVDPITRDEIQNLGFQRPQDNVTIEYAMVTMKIDVTNATYEGDDCSFLSLYYPRILHVESTEGNWTNVNTTFDFEGCLDDKLDEATRDSEGNMIKMFPNDNKKHSYSTEGKILLAVVKNSNNMLVIKDKHDSDYDHLAYFKLY